MLIGYLAINVTPTSNVTYSYKNYFLFMAGN